MNQLEQLKQAEQILIQAQIAGDTDILASLIADELLFVGPDGGLYTKAMDLESHRSGIVKITSMMAHEPTIELNLPLAVVSRKADLEVVVGGQPAEGQYRYLRVWVHRQGRWQILAGSCTQVASRGLDTASNNTLDSVK